MKYIDQGMANYIASFFDSEGHIGIHKYKDRPAVALKVIGVNCHLATLKMIQEYLGGHLSTKSGKAEHQQGYQLQLRMAELPRFIKEICPYLRTKASNGLLLEKAYGYAQTGWTPETVDQVVAMYMMIKPHRLESATLPTPVVEPLHVVWISDDKRTAS